jgi:hypothetical protein
MRWLMIGLLVSLGALLLAAAGVARHIWTQRSKLRRKPVSRAEQGSQTAHGQSANSAEDTEQEEIS